MDGNKLGLDLLYEVIVMIVMMFNHVTILGQMANLFLISNHSSLKENKLRFKLHELKFRVCKQKIVCKGNTEFWIKLYGQSFVLMQEI